MSERQSMPVSRRAVFAGAALLPALSAIPAQASDLDLLWAERLRITAALGERSKEDETVDGLCDELNDVEDAIMRVPITSRQTALRRLQLAAIDADEGERVSAPKRVSETISEALDWLGFQNG